MKILIVTQYFWPEAFRVNDVALGLKELGHQVTVLTGLPNYPEGRFSAGYGLLGPWRDSYQDIPVIRVPLIPRGRGGSVRLALNYISFILSASLSGPLRIRRDFDAILVYGLSPIFVALPGLLLKWLRGAPLLIWVQDLWPESVAATGAVRSPWILSLMERVVRFIYRHSDRILIQSMTFREQVERLGGKKESVVYLPNSAEELYRPLKPEECAAQRASLPPGFLVMFAGNIGTAQSFETIIAAADALRDLADIQWIVLGEGRAREWAAGEAARRGLGGRIHFLGRHPVETMPKFFALADVLLVTLKRDPLFAMTIPSKLQSYLACGRPVVAALDGEGAKILKEAEAGIACPAEDSEALADAVKRLYRMPSPERDAMGARGRHYFEAEFERGVLLRRLGGTLEAMVREKTPCAS